MPNDKSYFITQQEIFDLISKMIDEAKDHDEWKYVSNDKGFYWEKSCYDNESFFVGATSCRGLSCVGVSFIEDGFAIYTGAEANVNIVVNNMEGGTCVAWADSGYFPIDIFPKEKMYDLYLKLSAMAESKTSDETSSDAVDDNYIKMDGEKDSFEGGAIRYTKKGKGRYDLIPSQQIHEILSYAKLNWDKIIKKDSEYFSVPCVLMVAYPDADDLTYDNYIEIIINIVRYYYIAAAKNQIFDAFMRGFVKMLKDLAIHYEMGAEKYGVDNWKNGIPETKGERGGSFRDSGLRHLQQLLDGQTDEPHQISAIWNFIGAMYVRKHQNNKTEEIENPLNDEITIDLSHPDPNFGNICVISTTGNKFAVGFGTDYSHIQAYSLDKDKISVVRSVADCFSGIRKESYTITGMNPSHEHVKIDLSRLFSIDDDKNGKSSVAVRIYKGFHTESGSSSQCIFFRVEHESCPKRIENELWDKLYDDAFKDIVTDIRPV